MSITNEKCSLESSKAVGSVKNRQNRVWW